MLVRSKAPLRISFCGGGTDVSPYPEEKGGIILSATIDKYAYGTLQPLQGGKIQITSLDYDIMAKYRVADELIYDGELDLVKVAIRKLCDKNQGLELFLHSDAPPGSGLGSSSALMVCLIGLFKQWRKLPFTDYEIAELAYELERNDLKIPGGMQDQYATTFGGFNLIEFLGSSVIVNPLRIRDEVLNELHYRLLLCYTGKTRLSAGILKRQTDAVVRKDSKVMDALDKMKTLTLNMKNALLTGNIDEFGGLLNEAWFCKQNLDRSITNRHIDSLYKVALKQGALGGKLLGAGAGGYLLVFCPFDKKHIIAEEMEALGGQVVEFSFEPRGLQTWQPT